MPVTGIWQRFGDVISAEPRLSLAAFLGHAQSAAVLKSRRIAVPTLADFEGDPAYDPSPFAGIDLPEGLDPADYPIDEGSKAIDVLMRAILTWGRDPIIRVVHDLSALQCAHQKDGSADLIRHRDAADAVVRAFCEDPSDRTLQSVRDAAKACSGAYFQTDLDPDTASPSDYFKDQLDPDSEEAIAIWNCLGAPWMAAETIAGDWSLPSYEGDPPAESQSGWIKRNSVWPARAAEVAVGYTSFASVYELMKSTALAWAIEA